MLLLAFYRGQNSSAFVIACLIIAAMSFLLGDILFAVDSSFVYYMLPTRAGELLLGALAAQLTLRRPIDAAISLRAAWISITGAFLVIGSCFWTTETEAFPGWRAIPPTLGSAMLIVAGHYRSTVVSRTLRWKPLVWAGVVSYSAYLWHWPILSIPRYFGIEIGVALGTAALALTFVLAWFSYRYVEQPARQSQLSFPRVAWRQYVAPASFLALLCIAAKFTDGYGLRWLAPTLGSRLAAAEIETQAAWESKYICQRSEVKEEYLLNPDCVVGHVETGEPQIILWGDSNAAQYVGMLGVFAKNEGYSFRNIEASGCPPVLHDLEKIVNANKLPACGASVEVVSKHLFNYSVVWIAADWLTYDRKSVHFLGAFEATVRDIARDGRRVVIIGKGPVIPGYDRRCKQKAIVMPMLECEYPDARLADNIGRINTKLMAVANEIPGVSYFDANSVLCPNNTCPLEDESEKLIYFDSSHLSLDASWRLGAKIAAAGVPLPFRRSKE